MRFVSLADPTDNVSFRGAVINGAPQDPTSLYVPESIPRLSDEEREGLAGANAVEIGKTMLTPFVSDEIGEADLDTIVRRAATFDTPLVTVGDRQVLELFHGPTMAFKDVAARYLGSFMSHFSQETGRGSTVLVATSGDTGGAIAHGLADMPGVDVVVAYPQGRVSRLQQEQLRRVAGNVHTIEVEGTFNDCLQLTTAAFEDPELREGLNLTTANSINVGRVLPQTTYYAKLDGMLAESDGSRVVVPTGNGGNLTAGLFADAMGVRGLRFLAANNANDVLTRYLATGRYEPVETVQTLSNAMDVSNPKNKPRLTWLFGEDFERLSATVEAVRVSDDQTADTIRRVYAETGYVLDPHTAVAWSASAPGDIVVSTASPVKFAEEIWDRTGIVVDNEAELIKLRRVDERYTVIGNSTAQFKATLAAIK